MVISKKNTINRIKQRIIPILKNHEVKRAALFGSCINGTMKKTSDVDILIDINKKVSLLDFVGIKMELESALKRKVDLVEYNTIKPILKKSILNNQVRIL